MKEKADVKEMPLIDRLETLLALHGNNFCWKCETINKCVEEGRLMPCFAPLFISSKNMEDIERMIENRTMRNQREKETA